MGVIFKINHWPGIILSLYISSNNFAKGGHLVDNNYKSHEVLFWSLILIVKTKKLVQKDDIKIYFISLFMIICLVKRLIKSDGKADKATHKVFPFNNSKSNNDVS